MGRKGRAVGVPDSVLIRPTLMITGRSAAATYVQPAAQLARLARSGAILKIAHGYYAAVPLDRRRGAWLPSMETLSAGMAVAVYGPGQGALWGLSAARVHGALSRAISTGYVLGPWQHRAIDLAARAGRVEFSKRNPDNLDLDYLATELGPSLVTSIDQTILDLSRSGFADAGDPRVDVVRALLAMTTPESLTELAGRRRGLAGLRRALKLVPSAQ